jgi:hypothetical protein
LCQWQARERASSLAVSLGLCVGARLKVNAQRATMCDSKLDVLERG